MKLRFKPSQTHLSKSLSTKRERKAKAKDIKLARKNYGNKKVRSWFREF